MKNKNSIVLIIVVVIALLILGIVYVSKKSNTNHELTVTLFYTGDLEYDIESMSYKYDKIELTSKQNKKILEFYKNIDTKTKQYLDLVFIGTIKLEFSDGNTIIMDKNDDCFAKYNGEYIIKISSQFKEYILNIID